MPHYDIAFAKIPLIVLFELHIIQIYYLRMWFLFTCKMQFMIQFHGCICEAIYKIHSRLLSFAFLYVRNELGDDPLFA